MPTIQSDGCLVAYDVAGAVRGRTIVLVHGGAAHAGWWTWVVPFLEEHHRVVTFDMSGHGASGHRDDYSASSWAAEVEEVCDAAGAGSVALVGHSMGGLVAVAAGARLQDRASAVVLVDSRVPLKGLPRPPSEVRHFPAREDALARFRLAPPETLASAEMLNLLAERGLTASEQGWRWRFDPAARRRIVNDDLLRDLASLTCPLGYVYGTRSKVGGPDTLRALETIMHRPVPHVVVPGAFHHVPLDDPLGCASAIQELLGRMPG